MEGVAFAAAPLEADEWVEEPWVPALAPARVWLPAAASSVALGAAAFAMDAEYGAYPAAALATVCAVLPWLCAIDWATHRLPDAIVLPLLGVLLASGAVAAATGAADWGQLLTAAACAAGAATVLTAVAWFGGLGWGDVKLAAVLGFALGLVGPWHAVLGALLVPMALGGIVAIPIVLLGRRGEVAFGPFMAAGAALVALCPPIVATIAVGLGN